LEVESLEDRQLPSGYLLVGSFDNNAILRYSESTGAFVDQFDPHNLANLKNPGPGVFGPDGNLYVSSGVFLNNNQKVLQYNGTTGAFQSVFASQNITSPRGVLFGPDGNLYVANGNDAASGDPASVERFDGQTGAFLNFFVAPASGGLEHPSYMVFGPDGKKDGKLDLYVAAGHEGAIYRYDGTTGAFKSVFVTAASGGLDAPAGIVFGPDGNLYVASGNWFTSSNGPFYSGDFPAGAVLRFEGPSGKNPGAFLGTFVAGGSGGLANPSGILFGPDGDLYVASSVQSGTGGTLIAEPGTSQVLRYDGTTGAFLGTFVTADSGGLKNAFFLTFTETNPTTLNYNGTTTAATASTPPAQPTIASGSGPLVAMVPTNPPSVSIRFDAGELSTAFSRLQTPPPVPVATSSVVPLSPTSVPVPSLSNHLPHEASGSIHGLWQAQPTAVDQFFANLDVELSMPGLVCDLT
jgi:DNA-binding beta-propeller fold protein YncE